MTPPPRSCFLGGGVKKAERVARDCVAGALGFFCKPAKRSPKEIRNAFERGQVKKILLVRTYQGMGDLLCATPVVSNLKLEFPGLSIHFLANTFNCAALGGNPKIDRVWTWDESQGPNPLQWFRLLHRLRREKFDAAFILSSNALSLTAILLAVFSRARVVVGYETKSYGRNWGRWLYSCELPFENPTKEIDKFLGLLSGLSLPCAQRSPEYFTSHSSKAFAADYLQKTYPKAGHPLVGIFLGGKVDRPERIWPPEYYARVARRLVEAAGCRVLVIAPPHAGRSLHRRESTFWMDEEVHEREFWQAYGKPCPVVREPDINRVAALLEKLDLLICPDGGIMHLAAAVKAPTLALFLGTDPEIWHPHVLSCRYLRASGPDPKTLQPESVANEAEKLLRSCVKPG